MKKILIALAAVASIGSTGHAFAQNTRDDTELLISQIQTDRSTVVLRAMNLSDAEVKKFTPIYDAYQAEMKKVMNRGVEVVNKFADNYGTMTDEVAKSLLKDFFKVRDERVSTLKKYAKKMETALPPTKVVRWVQIENKLNALLDVQASSVIPLS
jgi:hypothetical protein